MPTALQELFPYAPLAERCIEVAVTLTPEEFQEKAAGWMAEIGELLTLPEHKSIEHWVVKIQKPKHGPPKPKAWLFSVPLVQTKVASTRVGANTESLHFFPPTEQEPAKLRYSQCKPHSTTIEAFAKVKPHFNTILQSWAKYFGADKFGSLRMSYWNDLMLFTDRYFHGDEIFFIGNALNFFRENGLQLGTILPPWNTSLHWNVPQNEGGQSHLEIRNDGSGPIWTIFSYTGKHGAIGQQGGVCIKELDIAHDVIYQAFRSHFTPEALEFCTHGKVSLNQLPKQGS